MRRLFAIALVVLALRLAALLIVAFVPLVRPAIAGTTHYTTYQEKTLGRLQTLCTDGMRAVSPYTKTLERWESAISPPSGKTCTKPLNPRTW